MKRRPAQKRPVLDVRPDLGTFSPPKINVAQEEAEAEAEAEFDEHQEKTPLLQTAEKDVFIDVDENDLRWKRSAQAAILSRLPSHRALSSDQGYTLARTLEKARRKRSRNQSTVRPSITDSEGHPDMLSEKTLTRRRNGSKLSKSFEVQALDEIDDGFSFLREETIKSMTASLTVKRRYSTELCFGNETGKDICSSIHNM